MTLAMQPKQEKGFVRGDVLEVSSYCFQRSILCLAKKSINNLFNNPHWNFLEKECLYFMGNIFSLSLESRTALVCLSFVGRKGQSFNTLFIYSPETEDIETFIGGCEMEDTGYCQFSYETLSSSMILSCSLNRVMNK